ncbi:MAG: hypothetical protein SGI88_14060 [Candidatus Hydrogenedentes bacterium]|nr:hypothetical protein [Candidatus Hydrogenedentota bacterium]
MIHSSKQKMIYREAAWVVVVASIVFALSQIPYSAADRHTPKGEMFLGQVALADDVNSYYSFIRQAAQGHWVFRNTMTYIDHAPVFVNIEWLALGKCMRWFGWSPRTTFDAWRVAGVFMLLGAFAALAHVSLRSELHRRAALMMCAIGGGFGWLLALLMQAGVMHAPDGPDMLNPALDLFAGIQPFVQLTRNPHFSLPHGTFILMCMFMIIGENTRNPRWYAVAALSALIHGLIRPYDLISLFVMIPVFVATESAVARRLDLRWAAVRCLPLAVAAPVLLYYVYIFSVHPVFRFWASQGDQPFVPLHWHLLSLGIAFPLFAYRIARWRAQPLASPGERFLAVWAVVILLLFHSYKFVPFMPYTPQLGVPLMTPLILLGVTVLPGVRTSARAVTIAALLISLNALSTPVYLRRELHNAPREGHLYIRNVDLDAVDWANRNIKESGVVLARYAVGTQISQFLNARVAVGHWALSPHVETLNPRINHLLSGELAPEDAHILIDEIQPRFLYVDLPESRADTAYLAALGFRSVYENSGVRMYENTTKPVLTD